jgi:hypothetical protein
LGKEYRPFSSSLCNFPHSPVPQQNILLSKNLTTSALFTTNSTWTTLTSNPGLRGDLTNTLINCKRFEFVRVVVTKTF